MGNLKMVAALLVALVVVASPAAEAVITCGQVVSSLTQCIQYLKGTAPGGPPPACCDGVKELNAAATSTPDRQTACKCLKSAASSISGINLGIAGGLPGKCGVSIPYKISPSTDCSTVR